MKENLSALGDFVAHEHEGRTSRTAGGKVSFRPLFYFSTCSFTFLPSKLKKITVVNAGKCAAKENIVDTS